jgi:hypothetical protein
LRFVKGTSAVAGDATFAGLAVLAPEARLGAGLTARQTPRDPSAAALDANSKTTRRALLLRGSLGRALLPSQHVLNVRRLVPLALDLLNVMLFETQELSLEAVTLILRKVNRANTRFSC